MLNLTDNGVYIFDSETDFLKVIDELSKEFKQSTANKTNVIYISKKLETINELKKEIAILNLFKINAFNGYRTNKTIRVCLSDNNRYIHMTYRFNAVTCGTIYDKLNRYLKKRQNIYI